LFFEEFKNIPSKIQAIDNGRYKIGIIERISDGKPQFAHKTFAEYFCALWLVDDDNWSNPDFSSFFRYHVTKQGKIMEFFAHLMIKNKSYAVTYPIHVAILNNDTANLENLLIKMQKNENNHEFKEKLNAKDKLMQRTPLQYAAERKDFYLVEILIKIGADATV
jgi:hypothetical protein